MRLFSNLYVYTPFRVYATKNKKNEYNHMIIVITYDKLDDEKLSFFGLCDLERVNVFAPKDQCQRFEVYCLLNLLITFN